MGFIIIIPARFYSSRFPRKLLADIHGKPMIVRVIEKALMTMADQIIVAVDNMKLKQIIESEYCCSQYAINVCLTKSTHQSGTERLAEVVKNYGFSDSQIIVNLQGDEPLISSYMIHQVVKTLQMSDTDISVTTLATPIFSEQEAQDSNVVKVIINANNDALYFSRSRIPWQNIYNNNIINRSIKILLRHVGIYSYRVNFLKRYIQWPRSALEQVEMLEQLRVLWNNERIRVKVIDNTSNISVNTPEELNQVNKLFFKKT